MGGWMAERFNAAVLKTALVKSQRGFESLSNRHFFKKNVIFYEKT